MALLDNSSSDVYFVYIEGYFVDIDRTGQRAGIHLPPFIGHCMTIKKTFPGEFEQMVLLAILQLDDDGYAVGVRRELEARARRSVSRGALYRTLDRLEEKGYLGWELDEEIPDRGGHPRRRFTVTEEGVEALRTARSALMSLWDGLDSVLGDPR